MGGGGKGPATACLRAARGGTWQHAAKAACSSSSSSTEARCSMASIASMCGASGAGHSSAHLVAAPGAAPHTAGKAIQEQQQVLLAAG